MSKAKEETIPFGPWVLTWRKEQGKQKRLFISWRKSCRVKKRKKKGAKT